MQFTSKEYAYATVKAQPFFIYGQQGLLNTTLGNKLGRLPGPKRDHLICRAGHRPTESTKLETLTGVPSSV